MKKLVLLCGLFLIGVSPTFAYTPKLVLLGQSNVGKYYLDNNSIKTVSGTKKQVVIYEKFSHPVTFDRDEPYQSDIKYHVFDCRAGEVASYRGEYYKGLTSNTESIGQFNHARYMNGDTGDVGFSYKALEFLSIDDLKRQGVDTIDITPYYLEAFKFVCR